MIILSKEQVLKLHKEIIIETGGSFGVRDEALLESALNAPFQSFDGLEAFPSLQQKAARLGFGIINNHAFVDGNKRIGTHTMLIFLLLNGIELDYQQDELVNLVLSVASGKSGLEDLVNWISKHEK